MSDMTTKMDTVITKNVDLSSQNKALEVKEILMPNRVSSGRGTNKEKRDILEVIPIGKPLYPWDIDIHSYFFAYFLKKI